MLLSKYRLHSNSYYFYDYIFLGLQLIFGTFQTYHSCHGTIGSLCWLMIMSWSPGHIQHKREIVHSEARSFEWLDYYKPGSDLWHPAGEQQHYTNTLRLTTKIRGSYDQTVQLWPAIKTAKPIAGHSPIQLLPGGFANTLESVQSLMSVSVGGDDRGATTH